MEKKTMGNLIAALRKANGMTQKDLAERLNVSDKTISRWERDDGAPDLSVIPVLAEIFGITCDELLRGECTPPGQRESLQQPQMTAKGEKQRRRLLRLTVSNYQVCSYLAMGLAAAGWVIALICNFAFLKGVLGFWLGVLFFLAGIICQLIFVNRAFLRVEDAELTEEEIAFFRKKVFVQAEITVGTAAVLLGSTLPLLLTDAYTGLQAGSFLLYGLAGGAVLLVLTVVVCWLLNAYFIRSGLWQLPEKEAQRYHKNHRLQKWCAAVLVVVMAGTFLLHQRMTAVYGPFSIAEGTVFEDYESFVAFMEQDVPPQRQDVPSQRAEPVPVGDIVYYDEYGNEITEEQAMRRTLKDKNGDVVCEYIERNQSVASIRYLPKDGTVLPITVCTQEQIDAARRLAAGRDQLFTAIYLLEAAAALIIYRIRRVR